MSRTSLEWIHTLQYPYSVLYSILCTVYYYTLYTLYCILYSILHTLYCMWIHTLYCRVWIHSETRTWHNNNIQSNEPGRQVVTTQHNHLASLTKWLSVRLRTKRFWVLIILLTLNYKWFAFFIKNTQKKATTLKHMTVGNTPNLVLRGMLGHFLKIQPLKKILEFQYWKKRLRSSYRKWNFKPKIKSMIEDLQYELYQLANGIGDHEIKVVNFAESTTIFLRDITCASRLQEILKLYMKMHLARR